MTLLLILLISRELEKDILFLSSGILVSTYSTPNFKILLMLKSSPAPHLELPAGLQ